MKSIHPFHTSSKVLGFIFFGLGLSCLFSVQADELKNSLKTGTSQRSDKDSRQEPATNITMDYGYVGGSKAHIGATLFGRISEQNSSFRYVSSKELTEKTTLRFGGTWQRFSFGLPQTVPLPNALQSVSALIGVDRKFSDQWSMRLDVEPGIYSDFQDISFDDINAPVLVGFSYSVNDDLRWFFGFSADARRDIPVLPGAGVRWKFADQWTLMFILPKPRIEYELNEALKVYFGGEIKAGTYQVAKNFGNQFNRSNLNNAAVDFTEFRIGPGLSWKFLPGMRLEVEGGYMPYREFNFHEANVSVVSSQGAPYGQVAIKASF